MKYLLFILIGVLLLSCDKQKQAASRLSGNWELLSYKLTDNEGLSYYSNQPGTMSFDYCESDPVSCNFSWKIGYSFPSVSGSIDQSGTYKVINKGDFMELTVPDASGNSVVTYEARILVLTKTDLELEFYDTLARMNSMIFSRK